MLIIPAATSRRLSRSPKQMALIATFMGIFSVILGIFLSVEVDAPSGPSIVIVSATLFFLSYLFGLIKKD
jgi:zinc transport system permease protein